MKKTRLSTIFAVCCLSLSVSASPISEALFNETVKHVDTGGEMLAFQNTAGIQKLFYSTLPELAKIAAVADPEAAVAGDVLESITKLVNFKAFNAFATSSMEMSDGTYVFKSFVNIDKTQQSIFLMPNVPEKQMDWQNLPADTVIAAKGHIDLGHIWGMIFNEMTAAKNAEIRALANQITVMQSQGIDINAMLASCCGEIELLVTGTSMENLAAKIVIPDANGTISAFVKQFMPPQNNSNESVLPLPTGNIAKVIYNTDNITLISDPSVLNAPTSTLGDLPQFRTYAENLPANGSSYVIFNLSQQFIDLAKAAIIATSDAETFSGAAEFLRPLSIVAVTESLPSGERSVAASNFSIPQLQQMIVMSWPLISVLPALEQARSNSQAAECINNMKIFGLGISMYADDHNGTLPASIQNAVDASYTTADQCESIIFLGKNVNLNSIQNPSAYPVAICDRCEHNSDVVHVLFADGHVETLTVPEYASEADVINIIADKMLLSDEIRNSLITTVSAY